MFNLKNTFTAAVLSLAVVGSANASEWVLDTFDGYDGSNAGALGANDGFLYSDSEGVTTFSQDTELSPHGVVTATVVQTGGAPETGPVAATGATGFASPVPTTEDVLTFNQDNGVKGKFGLFYTAPPVFLPFNLAAQGTAFYFDILSIDTSFTLDLFVIADFDIFAPGFEDALYAGGTDIDVSAISGLDHAHTTVTVPNAFVAPDRITTSFASFDQYNAGTDFSNVTAIFALIQGAAAADLSIDEVGIVPEPTSLAIFGLGLLGLAAARRRKA